MIREKLFRLMGDELPYGSGVVIEKFEENPRRAPYPRFDCGGERQPQAMIIGAGGEKLKRIASEARLDMEKLFGGKVYLEVWVKGTAWLDR